MDTPQIVEAIKEGDHVSEDLDECRGVRNRPGFRTDRVPTSVQAVCIDEPCPPAESHNGYSGAFSLDNSTGTTIHYQVKWGSGHWKSETLPNRIVRTHSYPLDHADKAPTPYVRFDRIGGDNAITDKEYEMHFYKVGPGRPHAKEYFFQYASDGRHLDIKAR